MCPRISSGPDGPHGGTTIITDNGEQFFVFGKTRIKITEHFQENGKPLEELIDKLIQYKVREKVSKTA